MFSKNPGNLWMLTAIVIVSLFIGSCNQIEIFEKNTAIPDYTWEAGFVAKGSFEISDTSTAYRIYLVLRHTDAYKYNNIWLEVGLQPPGDSLYRQKLNLILGDDANGWSGSGMNDIWETRELLNGGAQRFVKPGTYRYSIAQVMRDNPLRNIMSVGLRIEKEKD